MVSGTARQLFCREYGVPARSAAHSARTAGLLGQLARGHTLARWRCASRTCATRPVFHSPDFDYDVLVEDVRQFLARRGIQRAALLGHSMGGKAAMLSPALGTSMAVRPRRGGLRRRAARISNQ